jgi:hypothetical protein
VFFTYSGALKPEFFTVLWPIPRYAFFVTFRLYLIMNKQKILKEKMAKMANTKNLNLHLAHLYLWLLDINMYNKILIKYNRFPFRTQNTCLTYQMTPNKNKQVIRLDKSTFICVQIYKQNIVETITHLKQLFLSLYVSHLLNSMCCQHRK